MPIPKLDTKPWPDGLDVAIRAGIDEQWSVQLNPPNFASLTSAQYAGLKLPVLAAQVARDRRRTPRVVASFTLPATLDPALLALLNPRTGAGDPVAISVYVQVPFPDPNSGYVSYQGPLAETLLVNSLQVNRPAGTIEVEAVSRERTIVDTGDTSVTFNGQTTTMGRLIAAIQQFSTWTPTVLSSATGPTLPQETVTSDAWGYVRDLADRLGVQVYADPDWIIEDRQAQNSGPIRAYLADNPDGVLIEDRYAIARDDWYNAARITYTWTDSSNVRQTIVGYNGTPGTTWGQVRVYCEDRDGPTTQTFANTVATQLWQRLNVAGETWEIRSVNHLWLRPGHRIYARRPDGSLATPTVDAVTHDADGTMTVRATPFPTS